jgi:molecular chaperone HscB
MSTGTTSANSAAAAACWSCGAPASGGHFCATCGRIQPLAQGADYFALLGLPQKLALDTSDLERRFHQLSWKLHPDNFAGASEYERQLSLELSSQLNDAYRALREPLGRVEYLLAQAGLRKEGQQKQQAPPELLEEVFELNESLDELREARRGGDPGELASLKQRLEAAAEVFQEKLRQVDASLDRLFAEWDRSLEANDGAQRKLMERMNEALNRRSYIRNLVEGVRKELTGV